MPKTAKFRHLGKSQGEVPVFLETPESRYNPVQADAKPMIWVEFVKGAVAPMPVALSILCSGALPLPQKIVRNLTLNLRILVHFG